MFCHPEVDIDGDRRCTVLRFAFQEWMGPKIDVFLQEHLSKLSQIAV